MHISLEDQKSVYRTRSCRVIFRRPVNARLRKPKLIRAVHNLEVWPFSKKRLVEILRESLDNRIFEFDEIARIPELFKNPESSVPQGESVQNATSVMSIIQKEQAKLLKAIEGQLASGSYSDLTIISHGKERRVHQAIVSPQSEFVAKACHFRSQDEGDSSATPSMSTILNFEEEDPELVGGMIQF
ncbi:hypothetical protein VDGE_30598 [Verticillium dahliae]|uniref:Uncharacterized protein n=1 Tax=Verticillium dahliae TaxID=27337 RepID=A0A444RL29_VERDA|nr:hypothetical protein VDGE_30598 [Verticillium dahliae]